MRILYHHRTASKDGQAVHIRELIDAFRRRGHDVIIVGPAFGEKEKFGGESKIIAWLKQHLPQAIYELLELSYSLMAYRALERAYQSHHPDVLYERFNLYLLAGRWLHQRYHLPYFLEVNSPLYEERVKYVGIAFKRLAKWTQRSTWRSADRILPVTQVLAGYVLAECVQADKITVIPNGINVQRFRRPVDQKTNKLRLGLAGKIVLGFTGFVREWHGLDMVVDLVAADEIGNLHLLIVGDGPGLPPLVTHAKRLGILDRVTFTGVVDHEAVTDYASAFDIALQPSVTPYASPLKLFEYMALGRAIIAPKSANIEEILTDGENALLFPPGDETQFRACIQRLCADSKLREQLGTAARRLIEERQLTWDYNAERLEDLFQKAIATTTSIRSNRPSDKRNL